MLAFLFVPTAISLPLKQQVLTLLIGNFNQSANQITFFLRESFNKQMGFASSLQGHQILTAVKLEVRSIMKDIFFQVGNSFHRRDLECHGHTRRKLVLRKTTVLVKWELVL